MCIRPTLYLYLLLFLLAPSGNSLAEPNTVEDNTIHRYGGEVNGLVKKFRLSIDEEHLNSDNTYNSELFVTLDGNDDHEYSVRIDSNSELANEVITETLRYAYRNRLPVTIYHELPLEESEQYKIIMVQIQRVADTPTLTSAKR